MAHYVAERERGGRVPRGVDAAYPFSHVGARLREADVFLGNLECVIAPKGAPDTDHYPFPAPLATVRVLREAGVDVVSIANNHASDYGIAGFEGMRRQLREGGLPFVGGASFRHGPEEPWITQVRGLRIGVLGFYLRPLEGAVSDVRRARPSVDVLVVFNHWGRDDTAEVLPLQRRLGRALVDAGADVVAGTHAHVLQPEEWYRGKLIFYGLGNFVFSGQNVDAAHRTGGYLEVTVAPGKIVDRSFQRVRLDELGAPHWLDPGPADPPRTALSEPPPRF